MNNSLDNILSNTTVDNMLIVSGIIFTTYGIFSLLTAWNSTGSFEWPTVVILIIGITLIPVGKMIKKQQLKKVLTIEKRYCIRNINKKTQQWRNF